MYRRRKQKRKRTRIGLCGILFAAALFIVIFYFRKPDAYLKRGHTGIDTGYQEKPVLRKAERRVLWNSPDTFVYYRNIADREAEWLEKLQLSDGSFACYSVSGDRARVNPYFSSYTALALLKNDRISEREEQIRRYLDWYFSHMNTAKEDIHGIDGTIYDYEAVLDGHMVLSQISQNTYDSIDSYSAVFFILLAEYAQRYENREYLWAHKNEIDRLADVMLSTIENGYSVVSRDYPYKLLMDNTEVYQGIRNAKKLYEAVFQDDDRTIALLTEAQTEFEKSFDDIWWSGEYYYSILQKNHAPYEGGASNWQELYTFALPQLFPVMFQVHDQEHALSRSVYQTFCEYWKWESMDFYGQDSGNQTWSVIAYAGVKMEDYKRIREYMEQFEANVTNRAYPYYSGDSVWIVLTCEEVCTHYEGMRKQASEKEN